MKIKNEPSREQYEDFAPSLSNISGNTWEASTTIPVIGYVATRGNGWAEAKIKLWLVATAVEAMQSRECPPPKDWTDEEWRSALKAFAGVLKSRETPTNPP